MKKQAHTLIPPRYYYDQELFAQEQKKIFDRTWQFVGFTHQLPDQESFFCADVAGKSVVIKKFSGQLRAFHNVCSHRFSRLCSEPGSGILQCPYHGWAYDQNGFPYAIPQRQEFDCNVAQLQLTPYQIDTCGAFIFVHAHTPEMRLAESLGSELVAVLQQASAALGVCLDQNILEIDANWKIVVENTLEEYHVRKVHSDSLYRVGIANTETHVNGAHSASVMQFATQLTKNKKLAELFSSRPWHINDYMQQLIFPNTTLASAFGATVSVQQIMPLGAEKTKFISTVFATTLSEEVLNAPLIKAFNQNAVAFNRQVFAEDKLICEQVHLGTKETTRTCGVLGESEQRVAAFQAHYMERMSV
jgi:phenylpropionate dioxygenase-like ring-hydroxylating dioxygenase large terminal subunit